MWASLIKYGSLIQINRRPVMVIHVHISPPIEIKEVIIKKKIRKENKRIRSQEEKENIFIGLADHMPSSFKNIPSTYKRKTHADLSVGFLAEKMKTTH